MLDFSHIPTPFGSTDTYYFVGNSRGSLQQEHRFVKPRGKSMIQIIGVGAGGNGGNGAVGANNAASSGGGGGSGAQVVVTMPLHVLPDDLYIILGGGANSDVIVLSHPYDSSANHIVLRAAGGGNGGNASGGTNGSAGTGGAIATAAAMPVGWPYAKALAGQTGSTNGLSVTVPTTGLLVTGGTSGAVLGNSASSGNAGPTIIGAGVFFTQEGGKAPASSTSPAGDGLTGYIARPTFFFGYGGTGGGSTHGSATGAGLYAGKGGHGAPGCGGGGGGGGLTGSVQGTGGNGGPAFCLITVW